MTLNEFQTVHKSHLAVHARQSSNESPLHSSLPKHHVNMNNSTVFFDRHNDSMQVPYAFRVAFFVALLAVSLMSVIGNVLEVITFVKTQDLRTSTNYYITSMAVSDLLFVVSNSMLYAKSRFFLFEHSMLSFENICKLGLYLSHVSYSVSIFSLVLISVDRFVAIVFPMKVAMISGKTRAVCILLTWVIPMGILYRYLQFTIQNAEDFDRPHLCVNDIDKETTIIYSIVGLSLLYFAPLIIITIFNFRIIKSLRRTNPVIQGNNQSYKRRHKRNQRVMKILISINVVFFICWSPSYAVAVFVFYFSNDLEGRSIEMLYFVCNLFLPLASTAFNPAIIFTFSTNFQQALKDSLRRAFVKCRSCFKFERAIREENVELPQRNAVQLVTISHIIRPTNNS